MKKFRSNFRNKYGENWIFEFDYEKKYSYITGDDVDYNKFPVYDGIALDLILNKQETKWLKRVWKESTKIIEIVKYYSSKMNFIILS
ncbi:MAG: hypothetical protein FXF54_03190 [Kosmotoga sp.]|nr:MAG: hypothetical protein FXF54_03190 [Kosmotoga sp.]